MPKYSSTPNPFAFYTCITLLLLVFTLPQSKAQQNELGVFFGGSYYLGDLNPSRQFSLVRPGVGLIYRFNATENIAFRANGFWGSVEGDDARLKYNENRNLHFRSNIFEASAQIEINFLHFEPGDLQTPYTPYLFLGGGFFRFNPQAEIEGQWYNLKPLNTEGQGSDLYPDRKPYSLTSHNFLFGVGYKFNLNRQFTAAIEWGMRRTGTDYLDDVSTKYPDPIVFDGDTRALALFDRSLENRGENTDFQRGNPNTNDWYSFAGIILTFRIKNISRHKCPAYN